MGKPKPPRSSSWMWTAAGRANWKLGPRPWQSPSSSRAQDHLLKDFTFPLKQNYPQNGWEIWLFLDEPIRWEKQFGMQPSQTIGMPPCYKPSVGSTLNHVERESLSPVRYPHSLSSALCHRRIFGFNAFPHGHQANLATPWERYRLHSLHWNHPSGGRRWKNNFTPFRKAILDPFHFHQHTTHPLCTQVHITLDQIHLLFKIT